MEPIAQSHLVAGLGSLALGLAVSWKERGARRARLFLMLTLALATWHLAAIARLERAPAPEAWRIVNYLGAALSAPLALHLALTIAHRVRPGVLTITYSMSIAGALTASALAGRDPWLRLLAMGVPALASVVLAVRALLAHSRSPEGRPERRALLVLLLLGAIAAACALSDFIPRRALPIPRLGPLATLPFLAVLASAALRRRHVPMNRTIARVTALALVAAAASAFAQLWRSLLGDGAVASFLAALVIVAASGPLVASLLQGTRAFLSPRDRETARMLGRATVALTSASDAAAAWSVLDALPEDSRVVLLVGASTPAGGALGHELLRGETVSSETLRIDAGESGDPQRRREASLALAELEAIGADLAAPLLQDGRLVGLAGLGGADAAFAGPETEAALLALGHQALATLQRIEALELARRRAALAAVGETAASLAHDVRNPLGAIRGAAQVLAEGGEPVQQRKMLAIIDSESSRLGRVLGDFLEWSRPRALRSDDVDLAGIATQAAARARLACEGALVDVASAPAPPVIVRGDADVLGRAADNLVSNAREAAGAGGRVRIVAGARDGEASLRVEDDGPGIPPVVRARLFEPFVTGRAGGTGLGLAMVQRAAREHGGRVVVEDLSPRGTAFTLVLPRHDAGGGGA